MIHFKKHILYYSLSIVIFAAGLALIMINDHDNRLQAMFIAMTATCYFMWSLLHHYVHHELQPRVVVEYTLIASLGIVLSLFLFNA
jgi:hypothetical protein